MCGATRARPGQSYYECMLGAARAGAVAAGQALEGARPPPGRRSGSHRYRSSIVHMSGTCTARCRWGGGVTRSCWLLLLLLLLMGGGGGICGSAQTAAAGSAQLGNTSHFRCVGGDRCVLVPPGTVKPRNETWYGTKDCNLQCRSSGACQRPQPDEVALA
jgi:hypothetical protein